MEAKVTWKDAKGTPHHYFLEVNNDELEDPSRMKEKCKRGIFSFAVMYHCDAIQNYYRYEIVKEPSND